MGRYFEHEEEIAKGGYPQIHNKLKASIDLADIKDRRVLDLGACTGAMALWALREGAQKAVINDMNPKYIESAKRNEQAHRALYGFTGVAYFDNQKVTMSSEFEQYNVQTLLARRIIYELRDDDVRGRFIDQLIAGGLTTVYLQGLVRVAKHKEPLWNVELEAQSFIDRGFTVVSYNGNDIMKLVR